MDLSAPPIGSTQDHRSTAHPALHEGPSDLITGWGPGPGPGPAARCRRSTTGVATAKASTATARAAQPSVANEGPFDAPAPGVATVPPGAATMAACWAWATRRASAGEIGCAFPAAAEKKDNRRRQCLHAW